jgi:hypothetical protein
VGLEHPAARSKTRAVADGVLSLLDSLWSPSVGRSCYGTVQADLGATASESEVFCRAVSGIEPALRYQFVADVGSPPTPVTRDHG